MNQLNIFILLIIILASCQGTNNNKEEIKEKKVEKIPLAFAQNFLIEKKGNIHIITIKTPWQKATEKIQYILYPKGKVAPEGYPKATKIAVPVSKIICTSTIDIAFLEALGATDKIAAISNGKFVYSPKVRGDLASNKILEIGANNAIDYEKALTLGADLALVYSVGAEQSFKKFKELGIPTVLMSDFMEKTPLGRAEWLVFVSYFLGLETEATLLFKDISQKYERIKNKAQSSSAPKPTVLTGAVYKGT